MRAVLTVLFLAIPATLTLADVAGTAALQRFAAPDAALYSGGSKVVQKIDDEVAFEADFDTSVLTLVETQDNQTRLTVIRSYHPKAETEGPSGGIAREWFVLDGGKLVPIDPPPETQATQRTPGAQNESNIYFPFDLVPPFEAPEVGTDRVEEAQLFAVGQIPVKAKVKVTSQKSEGIVVLTRALDAGASGKFEFRNMPATLETWSEEYQFKDGQLKSAKRESHVMVEAGEQKMHVDISTNVSQTTHITDDAGKKALAKVLAPFRDLRQELRARSPNGTLESKLKALKEQVSETKFRVLADTAQAHFDGYRQMFELEEGGKLLAKIFGKPAPDFEFEDLSGKKQKLSEIIKGKVAYLNFWGVG